MFGVDFTRMKNLCLTFIVILTVILGATLYPFRFCPHNGVHWLAGGEGLYFNGWGVALTDDAFIGEGSFKAKHVSIELMIRVLRHSSNFGPREIFSFYDGSASPPLVIGMLSGRIFVYSRFEQWAGKKWYEQFNPDKWLARGKTHFITVTFGGGELALYVNGKLIEKRSANPGDASCEKISGRLILGSSPFGKNGWMGEIRGLAVYDVVLNTGDITNHYIKVFQEGIHSLTNAPGIKALYSFSKGQGSFARSLIDVPYGPIIIPARHIPFAAQFFHWPGENMRREAHWLGYDSGINLLLFIPPGLMLALIFYHGKKGYKPFLFAVFICCCISLFIC